MERYLCLVRLKRAAKQEKHSEIEKNRPQGGSQGKGVREGRETMSNGFAQALLVMGLLLLLVGLLLGGVMLTGEHAIPLLFAGTILAVGLWLRRGTMFLKRRRKLGKAKRTESSLASTLIPNLYGAYSPYIIEAAEQLGKAKDATAVPALMHVLEKCVEEQRPGWRDVAAALADALADIGDCRALELLYRLETVRGIGFIPNIRNAIAVIEPQAVLLRAGSLDEAVNAAMLLRPAHGAGESDKALLLRAGEADANGIG